MSMLSAKAQGKQRRRSSSGERPQLLASSFPPSNFEPLAGDMGDSSNYPYDSADPWDQGEEMSGSDYLGRLDACRSVIYKQCWEDLVEQERLRRLLFNGDQELWKTIRNPDIAYGGRTLWANDQQLNVISNQPVQLTFNEFALHWVLNALRQIPSARVSYHYSADSDERRILQWRFGERPGMPICVTVVVQLSPIEKIRSSPASMEEVGVFRTLDVVFHLTAANSERFESLTTYMENMNQDETKYAFVSWCWKELLRAPALGNQRISSLPWILDTLKKVARYPQFETSDFNFIWNGQWVGSDPQLVRVRFEKEAFDAVVAAFKWWSGHGRMEHRVFDEGKSSQTIGWRIRKDEKGQVIRMTIDHLPKEYNFGKKSIGARIGFQVVLISPESLSSIPLKPMRTDLLGHGSIDELASSYREYHRRASGRGRRILDNVGGTW